jgi:Ca2+-binding EF-hand superfamily protein
MWRHFIDVAAGLPANNGRVNFEGFRDTLARVGITGLPDADLRALFAIADEDGSGAVDWSELSGMIVSQASVVT